MRTLSSTLMICLTASCFGQTVSVRVATYSIKFLDAEQLADQESRLEAVIAQMDADAIGLQEIDDRPALEKIFDTSTWDLVIDDDSGNSQDLALAVRKSKLEVIGMPTDLNARNEDFLFPRRSNNSAFPNRRDVLKVKLKVKGTDDTFTAFVNHFKARLGSGGRPGTDPRREDAARQIVAKLDSEYDGQPYVLLVDLNDNPDDLSSNILETGDPATTAGPEQNTGPFMVNLCESLVAEDRVTHGFRCSLTPGGRISTVVAGSRNLNNEKRGDDFFVRKILLDHIFASPEMMRHYVADSVQIFSGGIVARGRGTSRASDHLPVTAVFTFGDEPMESPVLITGLLPNPVGVDAGNETVTLKNSTSATVSLDGWVLKDKGQKTLSLDGKSIAAGDELRITIPRGDGVITLTNTGDTISLLDSTAAVASRVTYTESEARSGNEIAF